MKKERFKVRCLKESYDYKQGKIYDAMTATKLSDRAYAVKSEDGFYYLMPKASFEKLTTENTTHARS